MMPDTCVGCSLKEGFIVGGILLGYLASALWVGDTGGWRYMYGAALPPALIVFAGMVSPSSTSSSPSSAPLLFLTFLLPLLHLFFLFCTSSSSHLSLSARLFLSLFFFLLSAPSFSHFSSSSPAPLLPLLHLFFLFCTSSSSDFFSSSSTPLLLPPMSSLSAACQRRWCAGLEVPNRVLQGLPVSTGMCTNFECSWTDCLLSCLLFS